MKEAVSNFVIVKKQKTFTRLAMTRKARLDLGLCTI